MRNVNIALCQMDVEEDKRTNLQKAKIMIEEASVRSADFVILPEMFVTPFANELFPAAAEPCDGDTVRFLSSLARENHIYLIGGSIPEIENGKIYNTSYFFDRQGQCIGKHRKMHLFDVDLGDGSSYRESDVLTPGDHITVVKTEYGPIGLAVCFDIRFLELFRLMGLQGVQIIFHPAAFNLSTGPAHWDISVRMRALDQQCYVASCAPARNMDCVYHSYAHSMVAGPFGDIVCRMGTEEGVEICTVDLDRILEVRRSLPILSARRTDIYDVIQREGGILK